MSDEALWSEIDTWFEKRLLAPDAALDAAVAAGTAAGLPAIQVAPNQGKLLHLLALAIGARRVLEVGTLGGYSAIWLARALPPDGRLVTLELEPKHAQVARECIAKAGVAQKVEVQVGRALDLLPRLAGGEPFDLSFIDADKESNAEYFDWAVKLSRPGSLIVVDNVVRAGRMLDAASTDASIVGTRRLAERVGADRRVSATVVQTVGSKGHDGLLVARVIG